MFEEHFLYAFFDVHVGFFGCAYSAFLMCVLRYIWFFCTYEGQLCVHTDFSMCL